MARILILANPIAGSGRARLRAEQLHAELVARDAEVTLHLTTSYADLVDNARAAHGDRFDAVVPVGGDGTVRAIAASLPDDSPALALLPAGTANVLARELGLPVRPAPVAEMIVAGRTMPLPVFEAGGKRFLQFLGAGLDGAMVAELEAHRTGTLPGRIGWVWPVLKVVARLPRDQLRVETADGRRLEGLSQVLATRVRHYGGAFRMPVEVEPDGSGALFILCFRQNTRWQWLCTALRGWWSGLRAGRDCELLRASELEITGTDPARTQVDGDVLGRTPVRLRPADRPPLRLAVPADHPRAEADPWRPHGL